MTAPTAPTRCPTCDRREATDDEWRTVEPGERPDLCWRDSMACRSLAVNWRARALAAEAELEAARVVVGVARRDPVRTKLVAAALAAYDKAVQP